MRFAPGSLRPALTWADWWPSVRAGLGVVVLFAAAVVLVRQFAAPIQAVVSEHSRLGIVVFVATSALAVLMPLLTNLPLLPVAVLAWGPWWTALLLLLGWVAGAASSFWLGRHARAAILRRFPSVGRHADIDRLIHPQHRLVSLVMLRMTFPVDVLSYALGLFSRRTTLAENALSTAIGGAPFALLFAWFPVLSVRAQIGVFAASVLAFAAYSWWLLAPRRGPPTPGDEGSGR
jgi:uncharacterized membrane protein YdjX (TVP38/TMEM64 family)